MGREARVLGGLRAGRKVVLGYPAGGSVTLPFHVSCLRLLQHELAKPFRERLLAQITHSVGLYVADNRTLITERFIERRRWLGQAHEALAAEGAADWLLQVDTDIEFPPTLLETLLELAGDSRKILAASVPLGAYPSCAFRRTSKPGVFDPIYPVPAEPIEVDAIATAVALIHREVFEAIADEHGRCWWHHMYLPKSGPVTARREFEFISSGEDVSFSVRAAACGFKLWCAHVPELGHYKVRRCSHDEEKGLGLTRLDGDSGGMGEIVEEGEGVGG